MREGVAGGRVPWPARLTGLVALTCLALATALTGNAKAADPAVFDVGAASVNINPDTPQYISGYGYKGGPTTDVHDPLEVRAFVVSNGTDAAAFVVADLTGWFSAYQGDLEPYGITHVREAAAAELQADGLTADRGSVIVSSTHTHAAPVADGIWGPIGPGLHGEGERRGGRGRRQRRPDMKPSEIWTANGNIRLVHLAERPGDQSPRRLRGRRAAADHVGPRSRQRCDERPLRERPQPSRRVQRHRQRCSSPPIGPVTHGRRSTT